MLYNTLIKSLLPLFNYPKHSYERPHKGVKMLTNHKQVIEYEKKLSDVTS